MAVESANLGIHLYQAQAAQQVLSILNTNENMNTQLAAAQGADQAKLQATEQVQDTREVENPEIQGDGRNAHSHQLQKREPKKDSEPPKKQEPPPDPGGRGQILDLEG